MDYGLLGGIGEALTAATDSYRKERAYKDDLALKRQKLQQEKQESQAGLLSKGYEADQDGNVHPTALQAKRQQFDQDALDANSEQSKNYRKTVQSLLGSIQPSLINAIPDTASAYELEKSGLIPLGLKHKSAQADPLANELKMQRLAEFQRKAEEDKFKKTPLGRLEKSPSDVRQKIGFITSGLKNLADYEGAFNEGGRQSFINPNTPGFGGLINSTPIDEARVNLEEAIGRLASGGAISGGEEARFRKMIPTASDDDDSAKRKIVNLKAEMENKLAGYGFQPNDLGEMGFDAKTLGYGNPRTQTKQGLIGESRAEAGAMPPPGLTFEQFKAWKAQNGR